VSPGIYLLRGEDDLVEMTEQPYEAERVLQELLRNTLYAGELHGVKRAQPAIVNRRVWNEAQ
jgi:hypothetical protein